MGRIAQDQGYMHKNYADWKRPVVTCALDAAFAVTGKRQTRIGGESCLSF